MQTWVSKLRDTALSAPFPALRAAYDALRTCRVVLVYKPLYDRVQIHIILGYLSRFSIIFAPFFLADGVRIVRGAWANTQKH